MFSGGIFGAFGMCSTQEIWNPIGKSWEPTISSRIGKEVFGSFLPERRKRRHRTSRSRDGFQISRGNSGGSRGEILHFSRSRVRIGCYRQLPWSALRETPYGQVRDEVRQARMATMPPMQLHEGRVPRKPSGSLSRARQSSRTRCREQHPVTRVSVSHRY